MSFLDGDVAALFGEVFGALYLDGLLHSGMSEPIYDTGGTITGYAASTEMPIKVQTDAVTWSMRQDKGYVDGDVMLIVLARGIGEITADHEITDGYGKRWKVHTPALDAARSHWVCRGRAA